MNELWNDLVNPINIIYILDTRFYLFLSSLCLQRKEAMSWAVTSVLLGQRLHLK